MASKKEINAFLKETGYTWEQMQEFWNENIEINFKVKLLHNNKKNWCDMPICTIRELPTLKEDTLKKQAEAKEAERLKALEEEEKKKQKAYYEEHFEELMLKNLHLGKALTESEIRRLVNNYEIHRTNGNNERWVRYVGSIIQLCNETYRVDWYEGLTEMQEDSFLNQPYKVEKHEYQKIITVTEWLKV